MCASMAMMTTGVTSSSRSCLLLSCATFSPHVGHRVTPKQSQKSFFNPGASTSLLQSITTCCQLESLPRLHRRSSFVETYVENCSPGGHKVRYSFMKANVATSSSENHCQNSSKQGPRSCHGDRENENNIVLTSSSGAGVTTLEQSSSEGERDFREVGYAGPIENRTKGIPQGGASRRPSLLGLQQQGRIIRGEQIQRAATATQKDSVRGLQRRAVVLSSMAVFGIETWCPCCKAAAVVDEDWSYGGPSGPQEWGGMCTKGGQQSPIDIPVNKAQGREVLGEMMFDYNLSIPSFKNTGHGTMQVNLPRGESKLRLKGRELELLQFHFHTPSEHAFDGQRFPMEAHLVHRDVKNKTLAVVGIMLDATTDAAPNEALAAALQYSPLEHGKTLTVPGLQVSAAFLLPPKLGENSTRRYMHYLGSLTTPPCSETVDWFLLVSPLMHHFGLGFDHLDAGIFCTKSLHFIFSETPLKVPTSQVLEFMKYVGDEHTLAFNARPIQPLGARQIFRGP